VTHLPVLRNFIGFQVGWLACVLGAAYGLAWAGTTVALAIVGWHLAQALRPRAELMLVLITATLGATFDSVLTALGWVHFPHGTLLTGAAPHWMVALWMLFATTLNVSLRWLKRSALLAALFGLIGGPLAYLGGAKLGAVVFVEQRAALLTLAIGWMLLTPLLLRVARRFDGFTPLLAPALNSQVKHA
jgi:hypothetical protein